MNERRQPHAGLLEALLDRADDVRLVVWPERPAGAEGVARRGFLMAVLRRGRPRHVIRLLRPIQRRLRLRQPLRLLGGGDFLAQRVGEVERILIAELLAEDRAVPDGVQVELRLVRLAEALPRDRIEASDDRLYVVSAFVVFVADVQRLMDVADEVPEENEPLGALLGVRAVQALGLRGDAGEHAVIVAVRFGDRLGGTVDVEEVLVVERLELHPGAVLDVVLFRVADLPARFVGEDAGVGEIVDLQLRAGRLDVPLRQRRHFLLLRRRQKTEGDLADDAMPLLAPREGIRRTENEQREDSPNFSHALYFTSSACSPSGSLCRS